MDDKYTIYTTRTCPFCILAKNALSERKQSFEEIDVTEDSALRDALVLKSGGRRTVPQIFKNGTHVGGYEDLMNLLNDSF